MSNKPIRPLGVGDKCRVIQSTIPENVNKTVTIVARLHKCESCVGARDAMFDCVGDDIIGNGHSEQCGHGVKVTYESPGKWLERIDEEDQGSSKQFVNGFANHLRKKGFADHMKKIKISEHGEIYREQA